MKSISDIKSAYFIGIGGIGMSAIARFFNVKGIVVHGYDLTETALTKKLVDEGMKIHYSENVDLIPDKIDIVVFTPAIPKDHIELQWLSNQGHKLYKRSEVLGWLSKDLNSIAVAGTHGKTSTSMMLSYLASKAGLNPTAFMGGISKDFESNVLIGDSMAIVEADEYDRSFLQLSPSLAIITSMDADHLDIYGNHENMIHAFEKFSLQIKKGGALFIKHGLEKMFSDGWKDQLEKRKISFFTYGHTSADASIQDFEIRGWSSKVEMIIMEESFSFMWNIPGEYNLENLNVTLLVLRYLGINIQECKSALSKYKGVKRRFEKVFEKNGLALIDDYAHHPEEIRVSLQALKEIYPFAKLTGVFQPHLYSRTKDHYEAFADALSILDEVYVLPIYPARELPMKGVNSRMITERIPFIKAKAIQHSELINHLKEEKQSVIITLGAGNLEKHHKSIIELIQEV